MPGPYTYEDENTVVNILRGEVPCNQVYRDDYALAFHDIAPQAPKHILVIPTGRYVSIDDFGMNASAEELGGFYKAVALVADQEGLLENGFRTIANTGDHGGQEVPHFHLHLLGGAKIGFMVSRS